MSTTTTTLPVATSNMRSTSKQTRANPTRNSRNTRPVFRQNSLLSAPASVQGAPQAEPQHGFYPAITHFTDAIAALPRDFRRHSSLLKEVDTKAWALEEHLQKLLKDCLDERQTRPISSAAHTVAGSTSSVAGDALPASTADSVNGMLLDTASQYSAPGPAGGDMELLRRRQLYAQLRNTLMHLIMPLDEKNHVLANANDELVRHTRRQDEIWPHVAEEISEEARLGSLRHWALTDLNPSKKTQAANARGREAAASLAMMHDDIAERSERRREAIQAKKQRAALPLDSDLDDKTVRRTVAGKGKKVVDLPVESLLPALNSKGKGKKPEKLPMGAPSMERQASRTVVGAVSMSREPSLQENNKKRKAPTAAMTVARKRINAATQESPKLTSSPIAGPFKDTIKRSPALSNAKPVTSRGRQTSAVQANGISSRPSPAMKTYESPRLAQVELLNTQDEDERPQKKRNGSERGSDDVLPSMRGGVALERSASKQSQLKREARANSTGRRTASPRLNAALPVEHIKVEKNGKSKASKVSTPLLGSFADIETGDSAPDTASAPENGNDLTSNGNGKTKRIAKPRIKDHHGLQDSLSPKALPPKRTHKKNSSYSLTATAAMSRSNTRDTHDEDASEKKGPSQANSRSVKGTSDRSKDDRHTSTPQLGAVADLADEAETHVHSASSSRRNTNSRAPKTLDLKPPTSKDPAPPRSLVESPGELTTGTGTGNGSGNNSGTTRPTRTSSRGPAAATNTASATAAAAAPSSTTPPLRASSPLDPDVTLDDEPDLMSDTSLPPTQDIPLATLSPDPDLDLADVHTEDDSDIDPDEQRYCYCNQISYGEMVACDNAACKREWFHLACTELKSLPSGRMTWYCEECRGAR